MSPRTAVHRKNTATTLACVEAERRKRRDDSSRPVNAASLYRSKRDSVGSRAGQTKTKKRRCMHCNRPSVLLFLCSPSCCWLPEPDPRHTLGAQPSLSRASRLAPRMGWEQKGLPTSHCHCLSPLHGTAAAWCLRAAAPTPSPTPSPTPEPRPEPSPRPPSCCCCR